MTTNRKIAEAAGYYIRRGSFRTTADDRLDRWYIGHRNNDFFRPVGRGYRTAAEAWQAAVDHAAEIAETNRRYV